MRFKVGDKVIVKSFSERPEHWNSSGKMDEWMGKIVTIRTYIEGAINLYLIEEDKEEFRGDGWCWEESDFLPIPKPGDWVKIRTWEDMEEQYDLTIYDGIQCPTHWIIKPMKKYCGTIQVVAKFVGNAFEIEEDTILRFRWGLETIEEVYPKEGKMEFTKDMLKSGEHVVEYRNGDKRLYLNGCFVGPNSGVPLSSYLDDLKNRHGEDQIDIVAVYKAITGSSFEYILSYSNELIWRRDDEPIEIPATEAFSKLREIYGKEVKIVEDKND